MSKRIDKFDARVACVSFALPKLLAAYERELGLAVSVYGDPDRAVYHAMGFGRASAARVMLDPRVWVSYLSLLARGRRPKRPEQDVLQLGGDVIVDSSGRIAWMYSSEGPEDRPAVDELLGQVDSL